MYSFEGDYRRKPQQNLAGASRRYDKSVLLQHAQLQRLKREQQRKRYTAVLKIQALIRSFVARKRTRLAKRQEYDAEQKLGGRRNLTLDELTTYFQKLLFFYDPRLDATRLVWMLQHFLKYRQEIKRRSVSSPEWLWRLRWILRMCMRHNSEALVNGTYSLAVPLRTLETFTSREDTEQVLLDKHSYKYLENVFTYLIEHEYFDRLRKLIDDKIPPMLEPTSIAPTPMAKCLSDMVKRPLELIGFLQREDDDAFSMLVLRELCRSILSPRISDPIKMFIVPSLAEFAEFPYARLNLCINRMEIEPTISLFYSILSLESHQFSTCKPKNVVLNYLKVLASMSSTIVPLTVIGGGCGNSQASIEDSDDSDSESNVNAIDRDQADILHECIEMLNDERHVQGILSAVDRTKDPAVLRPLCQLCHHLLITDKSAIHKYKLLYMLAFKPGFLKNVWTALLSARQISLFGEATPLLQIVSRGIGLSAEHAQLMVPLLAVFCSLFSLLIATLHDTEFFIEESDERSSLVEDDDSGQRRATALATAAMPFTTTELVSLSGHLKGVCLGLVELAFPDSRPTVRDDYKSAVLGPSCTAASAAVTAAQNQQETQVWTHLFKVTVALLRQLHTRDLRRQFCPDGHWIASNIAIPIDKRQDFTLRRRRPRAGYHQQQQQQQQDEQVAQVTLRSVIGWDEGSAADATTMTTTPAEAATMTTTTSLPLSSSSSSSSSTTAANTPARRGTMNAMEDGPPLSARKIRTLTLIREIPFVVPFNNRVVVFQSLIHRDKTEQQGELTHFMQGPSIHISVRRNYLYEDAFEKLSPENEPELRLKMRVQLFNTAGLEEAGVDGGGLFREFLSELLKTSFDPNRGFFRLTKDNMLYPNPTVQLLVDDFPKHYYFIGRILGKALYENLLVELPLAEFFLSKIVGRQSDVDVHHLASLDPIMYRNLLYLKSYKGEVAELGLDFTVLSDELGKRRIDELKPGGANIPVTNHNRIEYIHLMADYKLNKQIRAQCYAFKQGIGNVIPLDWLQMFNNKELQVLISGAQIPVDVNDLKTHTNYTGGYTFDHPTIVAFWKVVDEFSDQQKGQLLKFVTSCSRPPLLGFKELDPPFCIQHAGSVDRLPTSSTCMNLLKLPEFPDEKILREKLLYAIQAGAGFELS